MNKDGCKVDTVVEPEMKLKVENAVLHRGTQQI